MVGVYGLHFVVQHVGGEVSCFELLAHWRPESCLQPLTSVGPGCGSVTNAQQQQQQQQMEQLRLGSGASLKWLGVLPAILHHLDHADVSAQAARGFSACLVV